MMKLLTWIIIFGFFFSITGTPVNAIELDVEDAMSEFASEVRLLDTELRLLRNPFADYRSEEEETVEAEPDDIEPEPEVDTDEEEVSETEEISRPNFKINGIVKTRDRIVLVIEGGNGPELLRDGQEIDGYQFIDYEDESAVFIRNGQEFKLQVGGGA